MEFDGYPVRRLHPEVKPLRMGANNTAVRSTETLPDSGLCC